MNEQIAHFNRMLGRDPTNVEARLGLASVWRAQGEINRAVEQYAASARLLAKRGMLLEAIAACKAIFEMDPTHTETQLFLASLYARRPDSKTVAQVIAAVQPVDSGGWPRADALDDDFDMEESGDVIVLEAEDQVEELEDDEVVVLEEEEPKPISLGQPLFEPDEPTSEITARSRDDRSRDDDLSRDDRPTPALSPIRRTKPTPIGSERARNVPPLNYREPEPDLSYDELDPDDLEEIEPPSTPALSRPDNVETTPRVRARRGPSDIDETPSQDGLTYPDRVLRRALSLSRATTTNRLDHAGNPRKTNQHATRADGRPARAPDLGDEDLTLPMDAPGFERAEETTRAASPRDIGRSEGTGAHFDIGDVSGAINQQRNRTVVSDVFSKQTVVASFDDVASVDEAAELEREPDKRGDTAHTRVERPKPGEPPQKAVPASVAPDYDEIEVISPAALGVSRGDVPQTPLFSSLTPRTFMELLKRIDLRRVPAGQNIIDAEHRPRGLFIIVNGDVEVVRQQPDGSTRYLATLRRGEFFGEFELLTGRSHSSTVRAVNSVDLLQLSEEIIVDLSAQDPSIWDVLWDFYHQRLLNNMLTGSEIFGSLSPRERRELATQFMLVELTPGEIVIRQGDTGQGIYLVLSGEVEVVHDSDGHSQLIARLQGGEFFGTVSAVTDSPVAATITARVDTTLLLLPRRRLMNLAKNKSAVEEALSRLVERRQVLIGATGYGEFGFTSAEMDIEPRS